MKCCIASCGRRGRKSVELRDIKMVFCGRCWAAGAATYQWLQELEKLGMLTFGSNA